MTIVGVITVPILVTTTATVHIAIIIMYWKKYVYIQGASRIFVSHISVSSAVTSAAIIHIEAIILNWK
jgi:hypothetical protein